MSYKLIITLTLLSNLAIAQERKLTSYSDTSFWFQRRAKICDEIGLPTIDKSPEKYELRFWDRNKKVVRLWGAQDSLQGEVIYFLRQRKIRKTAREKLHFRKLSIDKYTIKKIEYLMTDFNVLSIAREDQVEGWMNACCATSYFIETCTTDSFSHKSYQHILKYKELRQVHYFFGQLNLMEEIKVSYKKFMEDQPFNMYYRNDGSNQVEYSYFLPRWYSKLDRLLFRKQESVETSEEIINS